MKLLHAIPCTALILSLAACGGGGDDAPATTPAPQMSISEYAGTWTLEPAANPCMDEFPFTNAPHYYRNRNIVLTAADNQLTAVVAFELFSDDTCSTKLGLVTETFQLNPSPGAVEGRDNVIRITPHLTEARMTADGGLGLPTLNGMPDADDTVTGWEGLKMIADVQGQQLFLNSSDAGGPLDSQGFPTQFNAIPVFMKN